MTNIYFNSGLDMITVVAPIGQVHADLQYMRFTSFEEADTGKRIVVNPALVAYIKEAKR